MVVVIEKVLISLTTPKQSVRKCLPPPYNHIRSQEMSLFLQRCWIFTWTLTGDSVFLRDSEGCQVKERKGATQFQATV